MASILDLATYLRARNDLGTIEVESDRITVARSISVVYVDGLVVATAPICVHDRAEPRDMLRAAMRLKRGAIGLAGAVYVLRTSAPAKAPVEELADHVRYVVEVARRLAREVRTNREGLADAFAHYA